MARRPDPDPAEELVARIRGSAKYRTLDEALVRRIAGEAAQRCRDRNEAVKYARRKLHQAFGAFLQGSPAQAVASVVAAAGSGRDLREACAAAMRTHASSAERLGALEGFYGQIARWCGAPGSVVDLACGLNPLAVPWMRLARDASYWACEIDADLVSALAGLDRVMPARVSAAACDLVAAAPRLRADLALMLKAVTTLEQQDANAPARLLTEALECRHIVLSLPRRSLSGRLGYSGAADARVRELVAGSPYRLRAEADIGDERLYHLTPP